MNADTEQLLAENGWEVECVSPFEIRHSDGSFATNQAARAVVDSLLSEVRVSRYHDALADIEATSRLAQGATTAGFERNLWTEVQQRAHQALIPPGTPAS